MFFWSVVVLCLPFLRSVFSPFCKVYTFFYLFLQPIDQLDKTLHYIFRVVTATFPCTPRSMSNVQYSCTVKYKQWTKCGYAQFIYFIYKYYTKSFNLYLFITLKHISMSPWEQLCWKNIEFWFNDTN